MLIGSFVCVNLLCSASAAVHMLACEAVLAMRYGQMHLPESMPARSCTADQICCGMLLGMSSRGRKADKSA